MSDQDVGGIDPPSDTDVTGPLPDGCESTDAHERRFTELADYCEVLARRAAETSESKGDPIALAAKMMAEAVKARRAASALARAREDAARVMYLDRQRALMRGGCD